MNNFLQI